MTEVQPLTLTLPELAWPRYWELKVSNSTIWVRLMKRPFGLFRNAISPEACEMVSHRGNLTDQTLFEVTETAQAIVDINTPADRVMRQLRTTVTDKSVKLVLECR